MTQDAALDPLVAARLAELKPVYDEIKARQAELAELNEAGAAAAELDRALAEEQRNLASATLLRNRLRAEAAGLQNSSETNRPSVVVDTRRRVVATGRRTDDPTLLPSLETPLPGPAADDDRVKQTNLVRRFLAHRLSTAHPEMLAEFNRIMNSPERPAGEGWAILDWQLAYSEPFGAGERDNPQKWVERLNGWGADLEQYRTALVNDINRLRPAVESVLPQLDAWRTRSTDSRAWSAYVEGQKAGIRGKREAIEQESQALRDRIATLREKQGQA